jgi:hypothetical protein
MSVVAHQVTSEIAYDLMQDHLDTLLALLDKPMARTDVLARVGSQVALDRLVRHGLVRADGEQMHAVASVYRKMRQEGMVSFLEHYVLPSLSASIHDEGCATLENRTLAMSPEAMYELRSGRVQKLFDDLVEISDRPAHGVLSRLTVMVVGTSRLMNEEMEPGDRALKHLQHASLQRATPAEERRAVLSLYVCLADNARYTAALDALERFLSGFATESADLTHANYHLTVASHWRSASTAVVEPTSLRGNHDVQ